MEGGQWTQQAFMWAAFVAVIGVVCLYIRWSNAKKKEGHVVVEYVPLAGHAKTFLAPIVGDRIEIYAKSKEGKEMIAVHRLMSTNRVTTVYGFGGTLLGVEMTKVYLYEGMLPDFIGSIPFNNQSERVKKMRTLVEKAMERGTASGNEIVEISDALKSFEGKQSYDLNDNPAVVSGWLDEKITRVIAKFGNTLAMFADKLSKIINPMYVYIGLGLAVILSGVAVFFAYQANSKIDVLMKGFGVQ